MQNIWDGGYVKHCSDFRCVCNVWQMVDPEELFAMMKNNRNGQTDEAVCDIRHTVH